MSDQVKNRNLLSPLRFDFSIDRLPNVDFFVQSANIPSVALPATSNAQGTPFNNLPWQGDRISWGDLVVDFKVDENLNNWTDLFNWIKGIGFPEEFKQYADLKKGENKNIDGEKRKQLPPVPKIGHIYGQGILLVRNSNNNAMLQIDFQDVYPTSLSEIKFDTRDESITEVTCTVIFKYDFYRITRP